MDKGMKGLLTGDLSTYALQAIETVIDKNMIKLEQVQSEIEACLEEQALLQGHLTQPETIEQFMDSRFRIGKDSYESNAPNYERSFGLTDEG